VQRPSNPSANPTRWIRWHDIQAGFKSLLPPDTVVVGHAFAVSDNMILEQVMWPALLVTCMSGRAHDIPLLLVQSE
jgi:hypothetical protein